MVAMAGCLRAGVENKTIILRQDLTFRSSNLNKCYTLKQKVILPFFFFFNFN